MVQAEELARLLKKERFVPFEMELSTGERIAIKERTNLVVMRNKCILFDMEGSIARSCRYIALADIQSWKKELP